MSGLPPRFTLLPVGDEGPPGTSLPRDHVLHSAPRVSRSWVPEHPTNLPVLATICCDQHPSPPIRTLGGSTAPDLCLQGWTHGRVRAQSDAEEKERRGQGGKGGGFRTRGWATVCCLTGVLCFPQLPRSKVAASEVTGKRLCVATNRAHCSLMTPGLPWLNTRTHARTHTHTHTPGSDRQKDTRPPAPKAASQHCSLNPPWGLVFHLESDANHQAPEPVQAHAPTHLGNGQHGPVARDPQDWKDSHCLNPHTPSLSISGSQRKGRPLPSERWFQTAGRSF